MTTRATANSRGRTFTGKTRSLMGCERWTRNQGDFIVASCHRGQRLRPARGAKRPSESERGCPPPLVAEAEGDQLRRGLAVARMD